MQLACWYRSARQQIDLRTRPLDTAMLTDRLECTLEHYLRFSFWLRVAASQRSVCWLLSLRRLQCSAVVTHLCSAVCAVANSAACCA